MRILINIITIIFDYKIKMKIDKVLIKTFIETLNKIFNESHMILNNFSDETEVDQNLIFSSANTIIIKKTIFVINTVF